MKKFTVYEIEKLTQGRISKYKLNQAIEKGELVAEFVDGDRHGRGIPKYFVNEDDLNNYLTKRHKEKKKIITFPDDDDQKKMSDDMSKLVDHLIKEKDDIIRSKNLMIDELNYKIKCLEDEKRELMPLIIAQEKKKEEQEEKSKKIRSLLIEISNLSVFNLSNKKSILKQFNDLL